MAQPEYPGVPTDGGQHTPDAMRSWVSRIARDLNSRFLVGKLNCTGTVTLTAGAASTTVTDARATAFSQINFTPTTTNARDEYLKNGTMYVSTRSNGSFVISHANNAQTDRDFTFSIIG